jgi:hypothetical protein
MALQVINGIGQMRLRNPSNQNGSEAVSSSSFDSDAQTFITIASLTDTTQTNAVNDLVLDLKAAGLWTKISTLYPMVGGNATSHKFNLKDPRDLDAAYRLEFNGGWTHSASGATPNGTDAYAKTFISSSEIGLNTGHVSYYSRTNNSNPSTIMAEMGALKSVPDSYTGLNIGASNLQYFRWNNGTTTPSVSTSNTLGLYVASRTTNTTMKAYKNGDVVAGFSTTAPSNATTTIKMYLGATNNVGNSLATNVPSYYSNRQCAFASIGSGFTTDVESQVFYQIVEKFQVALGRSVNTRKSFYFNRGYSNETNVFIFNAGITASTQINSIETLIYDLKASGIWSKMTAVYPMVGGTATSHQYNLINPLNSNSAFRLTFNGGWTHNSLGAKPNGVDGYANTYLTTPETYFTLANHHISYYNVTNNSGVNGVNGKTEIAAGSTNNWANLSVGNGTNTAFGGTLGGTVAASTNLGTGADPRGFVSLSRTSSTLLKSYRNGVLSATQTGAASRLPYTGDYNIGCNYFSDGTTQRNNFSDRQAAFISFGSGLTDMESSILYQIVEKFQFNLGRNVNANQNFYYSSGYTNETNAFIFNGAVTDATQISAVNTLVTTLKTAGIWTKMKAVYPMVGGTALAHKFNLVNPIDSTSAYALTFNGGGTHGANGYQTNGSNSYANTNLNTSTVLTPNNLAISVYTNTNRNSNESMIYGNSDNISTYIPLTQMFLRHTNDNLLSNLGNPNFTSQGINTTTAGYYVSTRTSSNSFKVFKHNALLGQNTNTQTTNTLPNTPIYLGTFNYNNGPIVSSNVETVAIQLFSLSNGLTDAEATTFYNAVQAFQTTLGRQV